MRLSELKTGEKGVIVKVLGHGGFRKRIVEMGFIKGKTVEVLLNAPLKDPIKYKIMGYEISLRRQEADMIEIISEQEAKSQTQEAAYHQGLTEDIDVKEEDLKRVALGKRRTINVALVGNPNCGKTSLFNLASGAHEHVGNYSGVTVDAKEGYFDFQGYHFKIVDLPGTYSLSAYTPEEIYVRRHIIDETPDVIINVVDSSNLERNLYLTTQLIDMNVRMVVALNMYDELENFFSEKPMDSLLYSIAINNMEKRNATVLKQFHELITENSFVLIGRCGNYIYKNDEDVTTLFIHSDMDSKIERTMHKQNMDRIKAKELIEYVDSKREAFHKRYTDEIWGDARNYQLTVNSSVLGVEQTAEQIIAFIDKKHR